MPSPWMSSVRVAAAALVLLGVLAGALETVGAPSAAGTGPLGLPHPVPISAVRYGEPPLKVLLVGDSMAGSLGVGLGELSAAYNVRLANAGMPGCSLSMDGEIRLTYFDDPPGAPCTLNQPLRLLHTWRAWVDAFRPDVVLYVARSDLLDQQVHGKWTNVGHRTFNAWFASRLRAGVAVLSSRGARVVLMTVPVSSEPTIHTRPQDNPIRNARDGALLRLVATESPTASLYDLSQLLTPGFRYRSSANGLVLHCADGVHLTPEAGIVVATDLYPRLWALARGHRITGGGRWALGSFPPATPSWYAKLACA